MASNLTLNSTHLLTTVAPFSNENFRIKRQLWYGYDYDGYLGHGQWSRIILSIMAVIVVVLFCLIPSICALGIWFAGWFGMRNHHGTNKKIVLPNNTNSYLQQQEKPSPEMMESQNSIPPESTSPRERVNTYVYEEKRSDHYYHRPQSPHPYDEYRRHFTSSNL